MVSDLKTTRPVSEVRTIEDVVSIERRPYDELVTARNLYDLLLATAQHRGNAPALTVLGAASQATSFTHAALLGEVTRAANMFRRLGLEQGRGVAAFLAPTLPQLWPLLLGAQVAGVASSLNYLLSEHAIFDLLTAQQATILVIPSAEHDEACWRKAVSAFERVPTLRHVVVAGDGEACAPGFLNLDDEIARTRDERLEFRPLADRDAVCALFHTGGTTGRPKVVRLTHGNQIHAAFGFAQVFGYDERDTIINGFPFFHVGGTITAGLSVLAAGGHVIVPSPYALRPQAVIDRYWGIVERFRATVVSGVPTSIAALTNAWPRGADVSCVRMAVTGGAVLPRAVGARFEAVTGIRLFETYGMTETAAAIAFNPGRGTPLAGSVGFRAPYSRTRIVRPGSAGAQPCAPEEPGLVQVRGPQVFPGYLDPAHDQGTLGSDGWLTTGDIGFMTADERLVLTGREKDLIVRSGHNIDPAAIEEVANRFEGVQISAAVGMPDQHAGEVPALFVVPRPGHTIDVAALQDHMQTDVHEPPARPRSIQVIDALPVTAVGKIYKPALRDLAIREKVRLDVARLCGPAASATVDVRSDGKQTLVEVIVTGASRETLERLDAELKPLAQTYLVRAATGESKSDAVMLSVEGDIAVLTLNRPESLNALSREMMTALQEKLRLVPGIPGLRVVVITGAGRAFSAGGDLIEFDAALRADKQSLLDTLRFNGEVLQLVEDLPVPVIGAANGTAVAGGLELLLCCDIIVAAEGAKIGDGHTRYGILPAGGATVRLMERISPSRAAQLFYTAALADAGTLVEWGLVNEVTPRERLIRRAMEIAEEICQRSPEAIRHIKALTGRKSRAARRDDRLRAELESFRLHVDGADLAKGLAAFRNKQPAHF